jgi:hypothetical protein
MRHIGFQALRTKASQNGDRCEADEADIGFGGFVVAGGDPSPVLGYHQRDDSHVRARPVAAARSATIPDPTNRFTRASGLQTTALNRWRITPASFVHDAQIILIDIGAGGAIIEVAFDIPTGHCLEQH